MAKDGAVRRGGRGGKRPIAPWRAPPSGAKNERPAGAPAKAPPPAAAEGVRAEPQPLRLGYVPGATPGKWERTWRARFPRSELQLEQIHPAMICAQLEAGVVDLALAREPVDRNRFHAISLYEEEPVVVFGRDHHFAASAVDEAISFDDLAEEVVFVARDDVLCPVADGGGAWPPGKRMAAYHEDGTVDADGVAPRPENNEQAIAWAASGAGVTIVPMSLARLYHRKDVGYRVLAGGPQSPMSLIWPRHVDSAAIQEFIGIVRGRTARSSRGGGSSGG